MLRHGCCAQAAGPLGRDAAVPLPAALVAGEGCRVLSPAAARLACAAPMPTGLTRPCLALLALLLSAFGVQRWEGAATVAAEEEDRPCIGTSAVDAAPLTGGLALLPDGDGGLPPAWQAPATAVPCLARAVPAAPGTYADLAPACVLRRGSAGGARAP